MIYVARLAAAANGDDDGQPSRRLRGRNRHHERYEHLSAQRVPLSGECNKRKVHAIEHQLNRHEDTDNVPLDQKADDSAAKQDSAQHEIVGNRNHQCPFPVCCVSASGFPASTTAPMIAIRINREVTSKGSRKSWHSNHPMIVGDRRSAPSATSSVPERWMHVHETTTPPSSTSGIPNKIATRLPVVRSSSPAFSSMITNTNNTIMAPA